MHMALRKAIMLRTYSAGCATKPLFLGKGLIKNMKIVISGYYGFNNSGDDALLMSIINDIKSVDENAQVTVLSNSPEQTKKMYGVGAVNRYNIVMVAAKIATCDLLISGGGTLIQDTTSTKSLLYYLSIIKLAKMLKRKVMLYANGIGPLNSFKNIEKTKNILNEVDLITLRDENSQKELEHIGVNKPVIRLTADPAFLLEPDFSGKEILETYGIPKDKQLLCISVRKWKNNPENFEKIMSEFCDYACDKYGMFPVFVPMQPKNDYAIAASIKNKMRNRGVVIGANYKVSAILSLMQEMNVCVGMRLHTLIYSASCQVPVMGIVYDPKVNGVMEYMGEDRFVTVEDMTFERMCSILDDICTDYDSIKSHLKFNMRILRGKARENVELMKTLLYGGEF